MHGQGVLQRGCQGGQGLVDSHSRLLPTPTPPYYVARTPTAQPDPLRSPSAPYLPSAVPHLPSSSSTFLPQQLVDLGYSAMDIITTVFRVAKNADLQEFVKLEFLRVSAIA